MDTNDLLLRWSNLSLDQIEDEIRSGKDQETVVNLLGADAVADIQTVSFSTPEFGSQEAVVLLPGIMGSLLTSIRGVTTLVWINPLLFAQGNARYLRLDPDGGFDANREVEVYPLALEKMTYVKISLNFNREVRLFEFPYDWRRPVEWNADRLDESLERWANGTDLKFTLVAHSMGGLVSRAYLARHPQSSEQRIKKLIMLGTPNFGATNAVETLLTGNSLMATVDGLNKNNGMVDVVRSLPGVYNLLPAPPEFFPTGKPYPVNWDIYDATNWRLPAIQQAHLDNTRQLYGLLAKSDPQIPLVQIAGCNMDTLVGLNTSFDALEKLVLKPLNVDKGDDAGDGTVPLWSSLLPGAEWFYIQEKHGDLPKNNDVIQAALNLIHDEKPALPTTLPEPKVGILGLSFDITEESPAELKDKITSGTATQEDLQKLYFAF